MDNIIKIDLIDDTSKIDVELTDYNDKEVRDDIEELRQTKVDKEVGKGLSTNDYTTPEKTKLASLENYDDSEVRALIDTKQPRGDYALESEIPTKNSQLQNDSGFISQEIDPTVPNHVKNITQSNISSWNNKQNALVSGTNIKTINEQSILGSGNITIETGESDYSELSNKPQINNVTLSGNKSLNDLGIQPAGNYITKAVNDLENYYKKTETFTKQEVNNLISAITTMDIQVVQTLPTQDISTTTIYLVPKTTSETNDAYDEYIYVSNAWEHIGSTQVDLTNYVTNTDYATASVGGVIKLGSSYGTSITSSGNLRTVVKTYEEYSSAGDYMFVGKRTLENVFTGKGLLPIVTLTQTQYDNLSTKDANTYYYIIEE